MLECDSWYFLLYRHKEMTVSALTKLTQLQKIFLNDLVKKKAPIAIYLKNGIKLKGLLKSFDEDCFLLDYPGQQVIYQHAVSTVAPLLTFDIFDT